MKKLLIVLVIPVIAYFGLKAYMHHSIGQSVDKAFEAMQMVAAVDYGGVTSTMSGKIGITDIRILPHSYPDVVDIGEISIQFPSLVYLWDIEGRLQKQEFPEALSFKMNDITLASNGPLMVELEKAMVAAADGEVLPVDNCVTRVNARPTRQSLLGYEKLTLGLEMGYRFDQPETELLVYGSVSQDDAVEMSYEYAFPLASFGTTSLMQFATDPELAHAELRLKDSGYYGRIADYCQKADGLAREEVIELLAAVFVDYFSDLPMQPNAEMVASYRQFVTSGSEFVIAARPVEPAKLSNLALYAPDDIPALLNLSTQVN